VVRSEVSAEYQERLRAWHEDHDKIADERQARRKLEGPSPAEQLNELLDQIHAQSEARYRAGLPPRSIKRPAGWAEQRIAELRAEHDSE